MLIRPQVIPWFLNRSNMVKTFQKLRILNSTVSLPWVRGFDLPCCNAQSLGFPKISESKIHKIRVVKIVKSQIYQSESFICSPTQVVKTPSTKRSKTCGPGNFVLDLHIAAFHGNCSNRLTRKQTMVFSIPIWWPHCGCWIHNRSLVPWLW